MTLRRYGLDAGPEGVALSDANSGSTAGSVPAGTSITFSAAHAAHGAFGARAEATSAGAFRRWEFEQPNVQWAASFIVTLPASAPATAIMLGRFRVAAGGTVVAINLSAAGVITVVTTGNSTGVTPGLSWGGKYRISIVATGGSTTAGQLQVKVYSGLSSWTTQVGTTYTANNLNLLDDPVTRAELGVPTAPSGTVVVGFDDIQLDDGRTTEIPDWGGAPDLNLTILPSSYTVVDASASTDGGGGALVFTFSPSAGVMNLGNNHFAFPQASSATNYTITATQSVGGLSDSQNIVIPAISVGGEPDYTGYTQTLVYDGATWL